MHQTEHATDLVDLQSLTLVPQALFPAPRCYPRRMKIRLNRRHREFVASAVSSGRFGRPDEVVAAALDLLQEAEAEKDERELETFHHLLRRRLDEPTVPDQDVYSRLLNRIDAKSR